MAILINTIIMLTVLVTLVTIVLLCCILAKRVQRSVHVIRGYVALFDIMKDPKIAKTVEKHADQIKTYILTIHEYHAK